MSVSNVVVVMLTVMITSTVMMVTRADIYWAYYVPDTVISTSHVLNKINSYDNFIRYVLQ